MNESPPGFDADILHYYNTRPEETRLLRGLSQLEAERTRRLITRQLPPPPATILDVGGASGAYAGWLAELGYEVHLLDPVPRLVEAARERSAGLSRPIASCDIGDARILPWPDGFADAVLLLGPLYHLPGSADRARALSEAARVLRPGGLLFAAAISRWGAVLEGLIRDFMLEPAFGESIESDILTGSHKNPTDRPGMFTTAYFHRPSDLRSEIEAAGFDLRGVFGVEGPARIIPDFDAAWADPAKRELCVGLAELADSDDSLLGLSPHLLAIGTKSG